MKRFIGMPAVRVCLLSVVAGMALTGLPAQAQEYPSKPVRLLIAFPPGGVSDVVARSISDKLAVQFQGRAVVVENRPGFNQVVALEQTARAAPDGHTAIIASNGITQLPYLVKSLPFDVIRDFAPVAMLTAAPFALAVPAALPVKSIGEFVTYAKANPGKINFGMAGVPDMLAGEFFRNVAGFQALTIRYTGGAQALLALVAGDTHYSTLPIGTLKPQVEAGKLRILAVTSLKRYPGLPNTPSIAESGYAGFDAGFWYSMFVPAATPRAVIDKLSTATNTVLRLPDVIKRFSDYDMLSIGGSPDELARVVTQELEQWGRIVKVAGIKPE